MKKMIFLLFVLAAIETPGSTASTADNSTTQPLEGLTVTPSISCTDGVPVVTLTMQVTGKWKDGIRSYNVSYKPKNSPKENALQVAHVVPLDVNAFWKKCEEVQGIPWREDTRCVTRINEIMKLHEAGTLGCVQLPPLGHLVHIRSRGDIEKLVNAGLIHDIQYPSDDAPWIGIEQPITGNYLQTDWYYTWCKPVDCYKRQCDAPGINFDCILTQETLVPGLWRPDQPISNAGRMFLPKADGVVVYKDGLANADIEHSRRPFICEYEMATRTHESKAVELTLPYNLSGNVEYEIVVKAFDDRVAINPKKTPVWTNNFTIGKICE